MFIINKITSLTTFFKKILIFKKSGFGGANADKNPKYGKYLKKLVKNWSVYFVRFLTIDIDSYQNEKTYLKRNFETSKFAPPVQKCPT